MAETLNVWDESMELKVPLIDNAHKKLYSILKRVLMILDDQHEKRLQTAAQEAIKFLLNYTEEHFKEEEEYMLKVGYPAYKEHKAIHDNMRENVIPGLQAKMTKSNYAREDIEYFIGIFTGWLYTHIMLMDQTIVGKKMETIAPEKFGDFAEMPKIDGYQKTFMKNAFNYDIKLLSYHYKGEKIPDGINYAMEFESNNEKLTILFYMQKELIYKLHGRPLPKNPLEIGKETFFYYMEICQFRAGELLRELRPGKEYKRTKHKRMDKHDIKDWLEGVEPPKITLLWDADGYYQALLMDFQPLG